MKIFITTVLFGAVTAVSLCSNSPKLTDAENFNLQTVTELNVAADVNVNALKLTKVSGSGAPNAYFYTKQCQDTFLTIHPNYVKDGKEIVPETLVFICL